MSKKHKKTLLRILLSGALFLLAALLPKAAGYEWAYYLLPYALVGCDVLYEAFRKIFTGQLFDETFLMSIATIGAWAVGQWPEAVAVMLFYQVGELFQSCAVDKSRRSIASLMEIRPDFANALREGEWTQVDPEEVAVGETILIKTGERVPLDGVVLEGESLLDTAALTGESLPRAVAVGDSVPSGCVNRQGLLKLWVSKPYGESTVARVLALVEDSASHKAQSEDFITRFARWYTPAVVGAALCLALIPSLITGDWNVWVYRGLLFLVVSCPCALVISIPLSFFGGIGGAARQGILVKGSNYLEKLASLSEIAFDKTGTLTDGTVAILEVCPVGMEKEELLQLCASAERYSTHPIARCIRDYGGPVGEPQNVRERAGYGVTALVAGKTVSAGGRRLMEELSLSVPPVKRPGAVVHTAVDGVYCGYILLGDRIKPTAKAAVAELRQAGVRRMVLLTGDTKAAGEALARSLNLDGALCELLPEDKVKAVEGLLVEQKKGDALAYVGDGINDAPVLARADVGVAMGALGSDAAIEAADVVLMNDDPQKLALAVRLARRTKRIVTENIVFALTVKGAVLLLGALGYANMWGAVFADVGVAILAVLNAMRCLTRIKPLK